MNRLIDNLNDDCPFHVNRLGVKGLALFSQKKNLILNNAVYICDTKSKERKKERKEERRKERKKESCAVYIDAIQKVKKESRKKERMKKDE